jgi:1,4-alpha-glucan branching enzyme
MSGTATKCTFCFACPDAAAVCLTGKFNNWSTAQIPMNRRDDGRWEVTVDLPQGDHRFGYCALFPTRNLTDGSFKYVAVIMSGTSRLHVPSATRLTLN